MSASLNELALGKLEFIKAVRQTEISFTDRSTRYAYFFNKADKCVCPTSIPQRSTI